VSNINICVYIAHTHTHTHTHTHIMNSKLNVRMGKKGDLSNFKRGMIVGARRAGLSISQSAQLLGFSHTTISRD